MSEDKVVDARSLEITFINGDVRRFAIESLTEDANVASASIRQITENGYLMMETDDRLVTIPLANVLSVEIVPKPEGKFPNSVRILYEFE
jgi:hypothetical protein